MMSLMLLSDGPRIQDVIEAAKDSTKSPRKISPSRSNSPFNNMPRPKDGPAEEKNQNENLEFQQSEISDATDVFNDFNDKESRSDLTQLKINWQEISIAFDKLKNELTDRQRAILELYSVMRETHHKMASLGEKAHLPPAEDLRIMNVTNMTPQQLLQQCAGSARYEDRPQSQAVCKSGLAIDVQQLYDMPSKLVDTCEKTLLKRKDIIDWFIKSLKSLNTVKDKQKLCKKIKEFNTDNNMLRSTLNQVKVEFVEELEDIVKSLRASKNKTVALQLRSKDLSYKLSELKCQNGYLRKQIDNADHLRLQTNKTQFKELQKELQEEKCKTITLRDRLSHAEEQVKMNQERASQLEAALEHSQTWALRSESLENQKLQNDFNELSTLTESIRENTVHLEEIADTREKLQTDKEGLENRLTELAEHYNESIENVKHEMNATVMKLIETENKYEQEVEEKTKLVVKVELLEAELHLKDAMAQMQEKGDQIGMAMNAQRELETQKKELYEAYLLEILDYKNKIKKKNEEIAEIERSYKESISLQQKLKCDIANKEEYIVELEKKQTWLQQHLQENELKMETFVEKLAFLKSHITQLQDDFGELENIIELHDKEFHHRAQLLEATQQNVELNDALLKKKEELELFSSELSSQKSSINKREGLIKILSENQEEKNISITILHNLEFRSQTDNNLNKQLVEENNEMDAIFTDTDMGKMSNFEMITLSLQDQTRKATGFFPISQIDDVIEAPRGSTKCRIPQRLPPSRSRPPFNNVSRPKNEHAQPRPNRPKDDTGRFAHPTRFSRTDRFSAAPKRPSTLPKVTLNEGAINQNKVTKTRITVPITQKPPGKNVHTSKNNAALPDQATIMKDEELRGSRISDAALFVNDFYVRESITSQKSEVTRLKHKWQETSNQFEKMKIELMDRQNAVLQLYSVMREIHHKMASLGEKTHLPPAEDLRIMNVTNMTPEQLLQLCAGSARYDDIPDSHPDKNALAIDVEKLYKMPSKLVDTCDQILLKRKEIIDWFDTLKSRDKGISVNKLSKKVNEFNAENDMLGSTLNQVKVEFDKELEEIVNYLRNSMQETVALQLRSEELTYELCELNSQNADFRKQIHNADHPRTHANKIRLEELQKELKEEKCKRIVLRDRLTRSEGQVKMNQERALQLEAALEQANTQTWSLERTVQQSKEQNEKLQNDFDKELSTLTESIRKHTVHLEEIADAREKLQREKEHLLNLAENYSESLKNVKHDMKVNVAKLIETEKKYEQEVEENTKLVVKVESLSAQLLETELRLKDAMTQIQENENKIDNTKKAETELETTKQELCGAHSEIINYKNGLAKQNEVIAEIERNYKESISLQQTLKCELTAKEEYIVELEKKQTLLQQQLHENESKMETYVEQLTSLKSQITKLQDDFGEFKNINELLEKINHQRAQLLEATRQNDELAEALQKKEEELEQLSSGLAEQESSIVQREGVIKMLSGKEEEQANIIKILRNNLELRSQADNNFNQQLAEKNNEIDALFTDIGMCKNQMSDLEKIILSLQDQKRKASIQRKKDQDKIAMLQSKITEYEAYRIETSRIDAPAENLDNLMKIIEDELGSPMEPQINTNDHDYMTNKKYAGDRKRDKLKFMGDFVKKAYIPVNENTIYESDNLDRKRAVTSIDTQQWLTAADPGLNTYNPPATRDTNLANLKGIVPENQKQSYLTRNLQYMSRNQYRDDRKHKMYKLAGHRL